MGDNQPPGPGLKLACKEPGCTNKVIYRRRTIPGVAYSRARRSSERQTRTVYLECPDGHVHAYSIPISISERE